MQDLHERKLSASIIFAQAISQNNPTTTAAPSSLNAVNRAAQDRAAQDRAAQ